MNKSTVLESSTPAKVHKSSSLPISWNHGSSYERQERARTSHACEPCRERKTKCDGERPSCHRCLHTGTSCHYGYGKGWRKRKTAEDLTATSRKLQIYESLLSNIYPQVASDVQAQIDEARNQDVLSMDTPDSMGSTTSSVSAGLPALADRDRTMSANNLGLPLPLPAGLRTQSRQPPPSALSFDRVTEATPPHIAHHPKRDHAYDDGASNRLPSITPQGLLIENGVGDASPGFHHAGTPRAPSISASARSDQFSPTAISPRNDISVRSASLTRPPSR